MGAVIELDLLDVFERREDAPDHLFGEKLIGEAKELNDITWQVIGARFGFTRLFVTADANDVLAEIQPARVGQRRRRTGYAV